MEKKRQYFDLKDIQHFLRTKEYPSKIEPKDFGSKSNFRRATKRFALKSGQMFYKNKRLVVFEEDRQVEIIHDVHCGVGESEHAKAMAGHLGKNSTYEKVSKLTPKHWREYNIEIKPQY